MKNVHSILFKASKVGSVRHPQPEFLSKIQKLTYKYMENVSDDFIGKSTTY